MKNIFKKTLAAFLVVLMLLSAVPLQGFVGVDFASLLTIDAVATGLELEDNDYITTHEYFVNSEEYYYMMENGCLYNNIDSDKLSDTIAAGAVWGLVGDVGKLLTLQFSNLSLLKTVSSNPFDVILADLLISYTGGETFNSASTAAAYDFYNKSFESLMNMLRSTSEWEDSYEEKISIEVKGLLRDPNYDFSDSNAYSIFKNCLGELFDEGTLVSIFDGLDCASKISEVVSTAGNLVDGFIAAYHAYNAAVAFLNVTDYFAHSIRLAELYMDSVAAILLEAALSKYEENINSDEDAFNYALEHFRNSTAMTLWGLVESMFSQSNTKFMAKVIGASPAEFGILTFVYNTTYQLLDFILKHSNTTNLAILTYAATLFEDGLSFSTEILANAVRETPNIDNAQFFDCSWGMLQCVEQYGYKTAAEVSLSKNIGTRIIKFFNKAHTNNDMEVAASWQSAWRNSSCHDVVVRASKDVLVQCPVDIEVYDSEDNLLFVVNNDNIDANYKDTFVEIYGGDKKFFSIPCDLDCKIVIRSREDGEMSYKVFENNNFSISRVVEYNDIKLEKGKVFEANVPSQINISADSYNLETDDEIVEYTYDSLPPVEDNIVDVIVAEELFDGFPIEIIDLVADTMFNMKSVVDLSAYDISTDDAVALFSAIAKYYPTEYSLIANSDFTYKIIVSPNLDRIMKIRFYYGDDANLSTYQKRVKDLNAEIDALVAKVEGMNEFEKALYIHDYIVLNCEYDLELLDILETEGTLTGELRSEKYTEYSVLVNGTGICGSYALAYRAILNAAGMDCLYLSSAQMNHAWNLVKIDGNWYHVDCCWDDPTPDTYGRARRTYFLRTDKEIMELNHYSWAPGQYKATSEKYSDMPRNYDIKQKYDDGNWYYLEGSTLYSTDEYGKNKTKITSLSASSIDMENGVIYYAKGKCVYEFSMDNGTINAVFGVPASKLGANSRNAYIANIYVDDNNLNYYYSFIDTSKEYVTLLAHDMLDKQKFEEIEGIQISQESRTVNVFDTLNLNVSLICNGDFDDIEIEYQSSDEKIATVSNDGVVKGLNKGTVDITVSIFGGYKTEFIQTVQIEIAGDGLSGTCGDSTKWEYEQETKTLTISGSGTVDDVSQQWSLFEKEVENVVIKNTSQSIFDLGITSIDPNAFSGCISLKSISIPKSLNSFSIVSNKNIETVFVADGNNYYSVNDGVLFNKDKTVLIRCFTTKVGEYIIPDSVEAVSEYAFSNCQKLTSVVIPDNVKTVGIYAFENCSMLTDVAFSKQMKLISSDCFSNCISLKTVVVPENITSIESAAFFGCTNLETLTVYNADCYVDKYSFVLDEAYPDVIFAAEDSVAQRLAENINCEFFDLNAEHLHDIIVEKCGATCESDAKIILTCKTCAYSIEKNTKGNAGHSDDDFDSVCDICKIELGELKFNFDNQEEYFVKFVVKVEPESEYWAIMGDLLSDSYSLYLDDSEGYKSKIEGGWNFDVQTELCVYECWVEAIPNKLKESASSISLLPNNDMHGRKYSDGVLYLGVSPDKLIMVTPKISQSFCDYRTLPDEQIGWFYEYFYDISHEHRYNVTSDSYEATCVLAGYKKYECACGNYYENVIEQKAHSFEENVLREATCMLPAIVEKTCTLCNESQIKENYDAAHNYIETVMAPTCTQKGYTTATCSECEETVIYDFVSPIGHEFVINRSEDYCEAHGTVEYSCKNCDYYEKIVSDEAALVTQTVTVEPTCTKSGTKSEICTLCGATVSTQILNPLSHEYADEYTVDVEATCTTDGRKSQHCTRCDAKRAVTAIEATGHQNTAVINVVEAACNKNGYTGDMFCYDCNSVIENGVSTDKIAHKHSAVVTAPTCTSKGFTTHTCTECGDTYTDSETAIIDHSYNSVETPVSCTSNGYTTYTCSECSHSYTGDIIAATGHNYTDNGTCTECGGSRTENCDHLCHKSGFIGFIWKIVRFFWKLFKINPICDCGVAHY